MKKILIAAAVLTLALRLASAAGYIDIDLNVWKQSASELLTDGRLASAVAAGEMGTAPDTERTPKQQAQPDAGAGEAAAEEPQGQTEPPEGSAQPEETPAETDAAVVETTFRGSAKIKNETSYDVSGISGEGLSLTLPQDGVQILIVHTHGSEAYTPDAIDSYESSDPYRTEDKNYSVIRLGDELEAQLESYGLNVLHDREIYDYPSYTGSYTRTGEAISSWLAQYPEIAIVIDLHRDALGDGEVVYKTMAEVETAASSQVMFVVGTDDSGLYHPNWRENLKLALEMQNAMDAQYPTLARPIHLVKERYNEHMTAGSLILEVGSNGNTLQEALTAVRLFAASAGPVLASRVV